MKKHIEDPTSVIVAILHLLKDISHMCEVRSYRYRSFPNHPFRENLIREFESYLGVPVATTSVILFKRAMLYYKRYPTEYNDAVLHLSIIYETPDLY